MSSRVMGRGSNLLMVRFVPIPDIQLSLTRLLENFINIGAEIVTYAHYVIFQMAEVAVPKELFHEIPLRLIEGLRLPPFMA